MLNSGRKNRILEKLGSVLIGGKRVLPKEIAAIAEKYPGITMRELAKKLGGRGGSSFWKSGPDMRQVPVPKSK